MRIEEYADRIADEMHERVERQHFLFKAGTYILAVSILVWFLLNLPWGVEQKKDSYLGKVGQAIAPVFTPLGFGNWEASSSLVTGIIASAAFKHEFGTWKWYGVAIACQTLLAWTVALVIYQGGTLLGLGG